MGVDQAADVKVHRVEFAILAGPSLEESRPNANMTSDDKRLLLARG